MPVCTGQCSLQLFKPLQVLSPTPLQSALCEPTLPMPQQVSERSIAFF